MFGGMFDAATVSSVLKELITIHSNQVVGDGASTITTAVALRIMLQKTSGYKNSELILSLEDQCYQGLLKVATEFSPRTSAGEIRDALIMAREQMPPPYHGEDRSVQTDPDLTTICNHKATEEISGEEMDMSVVNYRRNNNTTNKNIMNNNEEDVENISFALNFKNTKQQQYPGVVGFGEIKNEGVTDRVNNNNSGPVTNNPFISSSLINPALNQQYKSKEYLGKDGEGQKALKPRIGPNKPLVNKPLNNEDNTKKKDPIEEERAALDSLLQQAVVTEKPSCRMKDVAGLGDAKSALEEAVLLPLAAPHLFDEFRKPWGGVLLYGPPGTGKSLLARALAGETNAAFFSVSSSDLVSKWQGESQKLVRRLFELAEASDGGRSVICIDEVDALCRRREESDGSGGRQVLTELLIRMDGVTSRKDKSIGQCVVIGMTNMPWELDPAVRRRFERRIYVPLPDKPAREAMVKKCIPPSDLEVLEREYSEDGNIGSFTSHLAEETDGLSCADIAVMVRDALFFPIRDLQKARYFRDSGGDRWVVCEVSDEGAVECNLRDIANKVEAPRVSLHHFEQARGRIKTSVDQDDIERLEKFKEQFG